MKANKKMMNELFEQIYGLNARNVRQSHGSSITVEFGKVFEYEIRLRGKLEKKKRKEWQFWINMSVWRIDENLKPIAGCEDSRNSIEKALKKIENKKLLNVEILNTAYDMKIKFEKGIIMNLFSIYTEKESEAEQWILFTPEKKVLVAGPGTILEYENSGE